MKWIYIQKNWGSYGINPKTWTYGIEIDFCLTFQITISFGRFWVSVWPMRKDWYREEEGE